MGCHKTVLCGDFPRAARNIYTRNAHTRVARFAAEKRGRGGDIQRKFTEGYFNRAREIAAAAAGIAIKIVRLFNN
jgi:hypothetical protein